MMLCEWKTSSVQPKQQRNYEKKTKQTHHIKPGRIYPGNLHPNEMSIVQLKVKKIQTASYTNIKQTTNVF